MRSKATQAVYSYYQEVRADRLAPLRSEINPAGLKAYLPDLFFLHREEDGLFRFRLAGTRMCTILGQELRGLTLTSVIEPRAAHRMDLAAGALLASKTPILCDATATDSYGQTIGLEWLMMPLYSNDGTCDRIFGSLIPLEATSPFSQTSRLLDPGPLSLLATEDAAPNLATTNGQVGALISQSMQLRIYAGGRPK